MPNPEGRLETSNQVITIRGTEARGLLDKDLLGNL